MASKDFLDELAKRYGLSVAEQEVLPLVERGESIETIAIELHISHNAVRKRLGKIYENIGIGGSGGPGKLKELSRFLDSQYQSRLVRRVLICKLGEDRRGIAIRFEETIFNVPQLETEILDISSIGNWSRFSEAIEQLSKDFDFILGFLSQDNQREPLINCQIAFLSGRSRNFKLIRFNESSPWFLGDFPSINGSRPEEMSNLLQDITNISSEKAKEWVDFCFLRLNETINKPKQKHNENEKIDVNQVKDETTKMTKQIEEEIKSKPSYEENLWLQIVILISVAKTLRGVREAKNDYTIPIAMYTQYLIDLQRTYNAKVIAISTVKNSELFWSRELSMAIATTSNRESQRVFVFMEERDFDFRFQTLLFHAEKYNVYVMSYATFTNIMRDGIGGIFLPTSRDDFAIFSSSDQGEDRLLAEYLIEKDEHGRQCGFVRFSADNRKTSGYINKFSEIVDRAQSMKLVENRIKSKVEKAKINFDDFSYAESVKLSEIEEEIRVELRDLIFKETEIEKLFKIIKSWNRQHLDRSFAITRELLKEISSETQEEIDDFFEKFNQSIQSHHQSLGIQNEDEHNKGKQEFGEELKRFIKHICSNDIY